MPKEDKGKIKLRYFEVELEGTNEALLECVKAAANLANRGQSMRVAKSLPHGTVTANGEPVLQNLNGDETEEAHDIQSSTETEENGKPKRRNAATPRTPQVIEVDFKSGDVPLEKFCIEKDPSSITKKYLTIAAWFHKYRDTKEVSIDHIYTGLKAMNWDVQRNLVQVLSNAKGEGFFGKGSSRQLYVINHIGLNIVDKLPEPVAI